MERKLSPRRYNTMILVVLFLQAGFLFSVCSVLAAGAAPSVEMHQIETVVIRVDQYAVYVPNRVFYFDPQMDKKKAAALTKTAEESRNKKVVITYSSTGDLSLGNRATLVDISSSPETAKRPTREGAERTGDTQEPQLRKVPIFEPGLPKEEEPPVREKPRKQTVVQEKKLPVESQPSPVPTVAQEKKPSPPAAQPGPAPTVQQEKKPSVSVPAAHSGPISRDEVRAFVRNLLDLNEKKNLQAAISFYADKVDYYDRGMVDRDHIKRDLGYYFHNWTQITTKLDGDVVMIVLDQPDVRIAKFVSTFAVKNDKKSLSGKTENIWKIQRINGQLRLVDVKQKTLAK